MLLVPLSIGGTWAPAQRDGVDQGPTSQCQGRESSRSFPKKEPLVIAVGTQNFLD